MLKCSQIFDEWTSQERKRRSTSLSSLSHFTRVRVKWWLILLLLLVETGRQGTKQVCTNKCRKINHQPNPDDELLNSAYFTLLLLLCSSLLLMLRCGSGTPSSLFCVVMSTFDLLIYNERLRVNKAHFVYPRRREKKPWGLCVPILCRSHARFNAFFVLSSLFSLLSSSCHHFALSL